jgi:hypothetical protein
VYSLGLSASSLYLGGKFTSIGGVGRNRVAAIDPSTGVLAAWNPSANGEVDALAVGGPVVYVGGAFSNVGGVHRTFLAAIDAASGAATGWDPGFGAPVYALAVTDSVVYVGGYYAAAFDESDNLATDWHPVIYCKPDVAERCVVALDASGSTVYMGGAFVSVGGRARHGIAAVDLTTGQATDWDPAPARAPNPDARVLALAVAGSTVWVGGVFSSIGGAARSGLAAIDATTGATVGADTSTDGYVNALAASGATVYVGGSFNSIGGQPRRNIAALDADTGIPTDWVPNADSQVNGLAVSGSRVYASGSFDHIGHRPRSHLAAIDASTGIAIDWEPQVTGGVDTLAVSGKIIYIGGQFSSVEGQPRSNIAALSASTGAPTGWNPGASGSSPEFIEVLAIASSGSTVYAAGGFTAIGGESRNHLAAIDASTGIATGWNPNPNDMVNALTLGADGTLGTGGSFTKLGPFYRAGFAAFPSLPGVVMDDRALPEGDAGATPFLFRLVLTKPSAEQISVDVASEDGNAHAGSDYTSVAKTVTFAPGQVKKDVTVDVIGDSLFEQDETFTIDLSNPVNVMVLDPHAQGTILNDDAKPSLSIADSQVWEGNSGTKVMTFVVSLSAPSGTATTVVYSTANGTAQAGSDYVATHATVKLSPGQMSKGVTVPIIGDTNIEPDETFVVNLSDPQHATIGDGQATGTIRNDD